MGGSNTLKYLGPISQCNFKVIVDYPLHLFSQCEVILRTSDINLT